MSQHYKNLMAIAILAKFSVAHHKDIIQSVSRSVSDIRTRWDRIHWKNLLVYFYSRYHV